MVEKILILGGTKEAAKLAADLIAQGHEVTTSLAGRTKEPEPLAGNLRTGGFSTQKLNGAEGLVAYLQNGNFTRLIDATHPFATTISANARRAAELTGIVFEQRTRPPWNKQPGDNWFEVASLEEAVNAIAAGTRVLLALGSQHISVFERRSDVHFIVRMVDQPEKRLPLKNYELVVGKPPNDSASEVVLLKAHQISHIVCRNSGGRGAYAKIEAARLLGLPVIMIARQEADQSNRLIRMSSGHVTS